MLRCWLTLKRHRKQKRPCSEFARVFAMQLRRPRRWVMDRGSCIQRDNYTKVGQTRESSFKLPRLTKLTSQFPENHTRSAFSRTRRRLATFSRCWRMAVARFGLIWVMRYWRDCRAYSEG